MDLVSTIPLNTTPAVVQTAPKAESAQSSSAAVKIEESKDSVELSKAQPETKLPKISRWRLFFGRLTKDQIKEINTTKMLPENAKFELGGKCLANNWCNFTGGTRKLLPGYELKQNVFGFTVVVPEGTKGFWLRKTPEEKAEKA